MKMSDVALAAEIYLKFDLNLFLFFLCCVFLWISWVFDYVFIHFLDENEKYCLRN